MIKVLNVRHTAPWTLELEFSNRTHGRWDGQAYLATQQGPLLGALRDPAYFARVFIEAGALCWPNGLALSPARLYELVGAGLEVA